MLREIQDLLAQLYGIAPSLDVRDYLVTDAALVNAWEGQGGRDVDEKLLVVQSPDAIELALFLEPRLLERLEAVNPLQSLDRDSLADFCLVLEGVSHFVYLTWNAAADRCVTRLELEMQAEVDKYVSARTLLNQPCRTVSADDLLSVLFDEPKFHDSLSVQELERYEHATRFASWYCRSLEARFAAGLPDDSMLKEIRTFYRLPQADKLSHIHSTAYG
ncbi:MAG TPA: hypothetical protein ENK16_05600 [Chromatiales bacterium]|nr:hypothetical protein [Chromatiales bacterium]